MFMSVILVRCPVGCASSDIMMVVGDLLPALPVTTVLCPPPATVLLIFLCRIFVVVHSTGGLSCTLSS